MKFNSQLLLILTATTAYAYIDPLKEKQCDNDLDELYSNCFNYEDLTKESLQTVCQAYHSEKCQKLYKEGVAIAGDCKLLDLGELKEMNSLYASKFGHIELICSTDENNQPCPLAYYDIVDENDDMSAREAYDKYVNESCKSKKCTDVAIDVIKREIEIRKGSDFAPKKTFDSSSINKPYDGTSVDDEDEITYNLAFWESEYCSSQHQTTASGNTQTGNATAGNAQAGNTQQTNDNKTSGAPTIESYNIAFMFILLLLSLFLNNHEE
ncbi:hypothetical protein PIROE2DRAFT_1787 [Piromyces sp. E2]|nr:hypothetical protein PIROE2DRAFT_1787 [Piromyces sp. E2]|eukprot:OUM70108.1 hypothetical protein PIROE2DRAFT_1787 [Piromyces sp. E2]